MTDAEAKAKLTALRKRFKLLMALMVFFMMAAPLLGPILYADEFSHMSPISRTLFRVISPIIFGLLFLFYRWMYLRAGQALQAYRN